MAQKKSAKCVVRRITVDEKLFEDLIRLEVCNLVDGVDLFEDASRFWQEEDEDDDVLVGPDNYADALGIPESLRTKFPWKDLKEGQVFLSGSFAMSGDKNKPHTYIVKNGANEFLRIDEITREEIKELYYQAIKRSS
ncbi:MAG: hypothetical protein ABIJ00_15210 [Candidatus Eisenbacteria bacterium]